MPTVPTTRPAPRTLRLVLLALALLGLGLAARHLADADLEQAATPLLLALASGSIALMTGRRR